MEFRELVDGESAFPQRLQEGTLIAEASLRRTVKPTGDRTRYGNHPSPRWKRG